MNTMKMPIPQELFEPAAHVRREGVFEPFCLHVGPDEYAFDAPLSWSVDITNTGGALLVAGTVRGEARGACARCLEDARFPVTGEIEGFYLMRPEGEADVPDDVGEDEFEMLPEDKAIDLAPLIEAALVLEMPLVPLCSDDCRGICPQCGVNLNAEACTCAPPDGAPPDGGPFAALKDFKF